MTPPSRRRRMLAIITLLYWTVLPTAFCGWVFYGWLITAESALVTNTRNVEVLLDFARNNPTGAFPEGALGFELSYMSATHLSGCWTVLQAAMQDGGDYTLAAEQNPYQFRDVDDSRVTITFADGQQISIDFYQGTLVGCRIE